MRADLLYSGLFLWLAGMWMIAWFPNQLPIPFITVTGIGITLFLQGLLHDRITWKLPHKFSNRQLCLAFLIIATFISSLYANNKYLVGSDSFYYLVAARNILERGEYVVWNADQWIAWANPPMFSILIAVSSFLFPFGNLNSRLENGGMLVVACASAISVYLIYLIVRDMFHDKLRNEFIGLFAATTLATYDTFLVYARHLMSDMPSLMFVLAGLYTFLMYEKTTQRRYLLGSSIALGLSILTRYPNVLILMGLAIYKLWKERCKVINLKNASLFSVATALGFSYYMYNLLLGKNHVTDWLHSLWGASYTRIMPQHFVLTLNPSLLYMLTDTILYANVMAVFLVVGLLSRGNYPKKLFISLFVPTYFIFALYFWYDMRFLIPVLLPVFAISGYGVYKVFMSLIQTRTCLSLSIRKYHKVFCVSLKLSEKVVKTIFMLCIIAFLNPWFIAGMSDLYAFETTYPLSSTVWKDDMLQWMVENVNSSSDTYVINTFNSVFPYYTEFKDVPFVMVTRQFIIGLMEEGNRVYVIAPSHVVIDYAAGDNFFCQATIESWNGINANFTLQHIVDRLYRVVDVKVAGKDD